MFIILVMSSRRTRAHLLETLGLLVTSWWLPTASSSSDPPSSTRSRPTASNGNLLILMYALLYRSREPLVDHRIRQGLLNRHHVQLGWSRLQVEIDHSHHWIECYGWNFVWASLSVLFLTCSYHFCLCFTLNDSFHTIFFSFCFNYCIILSFWTNELNTLLFCFVHSCVSVRLIQYSFFWCFIISNSSDNPKNQLRNFKYLLLGFPW